MSNLEKLASDVPGILTAGAEHMRKLATSNVALLERAEGAEHELRLMKLARRMETRGLEPSLSYEEKVASLREHPTEGIGSLEQAVELAAGGFSLGRLEEAGDKGEKVASAQSGEIYHTNAGGGDDLDEFVSTQQAFG